MRSMYTVTQDQRVSGGDIFLCAALTRYVLIKQIVSFFVYTFMLERLSEKLPPPLLGPQDSLLVALERDLDLSTGLVFITMKFTL